MKLPITNIDRGNGNAVVFLDLKKAFDTVDHDILLFKMKLYGIQGIARTQESVHLNAGYHREQSLVPFYFIFTSTICQTAFMPA